VILPRARAWEELGTGVFDLFVIGGGIIGSRVAFDAARYGLRVALVDAGDFGGATSGASARLIHGGLRYLGKGEIRLVRAALRERDVLASRIAPHLVRPQPFVLSVAGGKRERSRCMAGLLLYAALGGLRRPLPRFVAREKATFLVPPLRTNGLASHAVFYEAATDDSRLTLATVTAAARSGAVVTNYVRVAHLEPGVVSRVTLKGPEGTLLVRCRAVVNATGPWVDRVRKMEDPGCRPIARLSKGVHVVLRPGDSWRAALAVSLEDGNHFYAVPCEDTVLLGTTDEEYEGDPARVAAEPDDVSHLLRRSGQILDQGMLEEERVISAFAGLRVLTRGEGATLDARRDHLLSVGTGGMISVAGGKLTTHRRIALDVLRHLPDAVRPRNLRLCQDPLPGASFSCTRDQFPCVDVSAMDHLRYHYGGEASRLLAYRREFPDAIDRIIAGVPDLWAQVYHAIREEWAVTAEDVIHRRTTLGLRGLDSPELRRTISTFLDPGPDVLQERGGQGDSHRRMGPTVTARYRAD
jgi:glycerol-3-phosphate dehydrogenase